MAKWKTVRVKQELVKEIKKKVETSQYASLSEFVSEAIRNRLQTLTKEGIPKYLERDACGRSSQLKAHLLYTSKHIWVQVTHQGNVKIGITGYFQNQVKDVTSIQTVQLGEKVSKDEPYGVVESWWFVYDLYAPLNGKIVSVNEKVIDDPFILNADPYQWIVEVKPSEVNSWMKGLLDLEGYEEKVAKLEGRPTHKSAPKLRRTPGKSENEHREKQMPKWRTVPVRKQLMAAAKSTLGKNYHSSLSDFVTEAVQLRLDELKQSHETIAKQFEYPVIRERLLFTSNHMWAMVTPEGNVKVGLSYYAQMRLKGIASIHTDLIGCKVKKTEPFGVVETWMFMFDLYSPVSGKITKFNKTLHEEPFILNENPYEILWIAEIKPDNLVTLEEELRELMRPDQYRTWVNNLGPPRILGL